MLKEGLYLAESMVTALNIKENLLVKLKEQDFWPFFLM